jgi:Putative peptidoglycan binding domain
MPLVTLKLKSRGPDVERWQRFLIQRGLLQGDANKPDGIFGDSVDAATRAFQKANQLKEDGLVGAKTLEVARSLGYPTIVRLRQADVTKELSDWAKQIRDAHWSEAIGTEFRHDFAGSSFVARIELHYHEPNGPIKPWGYHHGVSLFREMKTESLEVLDA